MTKTEVRKVGGAFIEEVDEHLWKLTQQFQPMTPGLYPYLDSRQVYLYFDDAGRLMAINVRGSYSVYP